MPDKDQSGVLYGRATSALEQQQIIFDLLGAKKRACQDMGLKDHLAFVDPVAPHPLPVYRQARWSGDPRFLRHPLAWLPSGLANSALPASRVPPRFARACAQPPPCSL